MRRRLTPVSAYVFAAVLSLGLFLVANHLLTLPVHKPHATDAGIVFAFMFGIWTMFWANEGLEDWIEVRGRRQRGRGRRGRRA